MSAKPTAIDLFCGSGGLSEGLRQAGFDVSIGIDNDENAIKTYDKNHKSKAIARDIREIEECDLVNYLKDIDKSLSDIDLIAGSPPCKGFSQANRQTGDSSNPMNDLYKEMMRIIKISSPNAVLIENVPNFLRKSGGEYKNAVIEKLEKRGYNVGCDVLRADHFGVPQRRKRAFIIASNKNNPKLPAPQFNYAGDSLPEPPTVADAIKDLPRLPTGGGGANKLKHEPNRKSVSQYASKLQSNSNIIRNHQTSVNREKTYQRFSHVPQGGNWKDIPADLMQNYSNRSRTHDNIYYRLEEDGLALTIANFRKQMLIHPTQDRLLSIREAARLQSFPDGYIFEANGICAKQQMVGNAVPVLLAKAIGDQIIKDNECIAEGEIAGSG